MRLDNDDGFWDELDRPRRSRRGRAGRARAVAPTVAERAAPSVDGPDLVEPLWMPVGPSPGRGAQARIGVLALLTVLAVPVAATLGDRDGSESTLTPAAAPAVEMAAEPTAPPTSAAPSVTPSSVAAAPPTVAPVTTPPSATAPAVARAVGATPMASQAPTTTAGEQTAATATEQATRRCVTIFYTVLAGDSWIGIATRVRVTLDDLYAANGASASTPLYPGGTICLPWNAKVPRDEAPTTAVDTSAPATSAPPNTQGVPSTSAPTTTPATTAPPTTVPRTYSRAEVEAIIRDVWPDDLEDRAVAVAIRESNLVPTAKNYCCYGLFQIYWAVHRGWLADIGVTSSGQLFDPHVNASAALALYERSGGWGPWE